MVPRYLRDTTKPHFFILTHSIAKTGMSNMNNESSLTKAQQSRPASLLKQLRATAALMCYDHCFSLLTMPSVEFQRKIFDMYHGDEDKNMTSQVEFVCAGKRMYSKLHQHHHTMVTNAEEGIYVNISNESKTLMLHPALLEYENHIQYITGKYFNPKMLMSSTKTLSK